MPREHLPLSQQKEFKAIKNMVIREAEQLRLGTFTFEDSRVRDEVDEDQDAVYFAWNSSWQMTEIYQSAKEGIVPNPYAAWMNLTPAFLLES